LIKTCKMCEKEFESKNKQTLYCSKYCQGQSKKKPRTCVNCGSIFMSKSKQQRFCSNSCGFQYNKKDTNITLTCAKCQKSFERHRDRIRYDISYCSRECSDGALRPSKVTSVEIQCSNCETTFSREPNAMKEKFNYCSHSCYVDHYKKLGLRQGVNNGMYNDKLTQEEREKGRNYTEYYAWRDGVFERDLYTCQCCLRRGVTLNAHHIHNYSTHRELRTELENGITMCEGCHKEFHTKYGRFQNNVQQLEEFISRNKLIPSRATQECEEGVETNRVPLEQ
jgi:5-methylcytosine-specific restriction endonuclease McrA